MIKQTDCNSRCSNLPGTDMSATSLRALHTGVAIPSSHKASYAAKKDVTDFLSQQVKIVKQLQKQRLALSSEYFEIEMSKDIGPIWQAFGFLLLGSRQLVKHSFQDSRRTAKAGPVW